MEDQRPHSGRRIILRLEAFAWEAISQEAEREGLTVDALITYSVLYYLADIDSGRIARRVPGSRDGISLLSDSS